MVIFSQIKPRRLKLTFLMASFFEIEHRVDTNIIIALVTAVVDTFDEPSLITNADTFENFLERTNEPDILMGTESTTKL